MQDTMLEWKLAENMTRPYGDTVKVNMNYVISAPRMYQGRIESIVSRTTGFADMIQLTHLKLQQVLARLVPDGVYVDVDGLAEVDLGNGTNYNPAEALNMYFKYLILISFVFKKQHLMLVNITVYLPIALSIVLSTWIFLYSF